MHGKPRAQEEHFAISQNDEQSRRTVRAYGENSIIS